MIICKITGHRYMVIEQNIFGKTMMCCQRCGHQRAAL